VVVGGLAACVPAPAPVVTPGQGVGPGARGVLIVRGGRFDDDQAGKFILNYAVDTRRNLCFAMVDWGYVAGRSGVAPVDCCAVRAFLPDEARGWAASLSCAAPMPDAAPPGAPTAPAR